MGRRLIIVLASAALTFGFCWAFLRSRGLDAGEREVSLARGGETSVTIDRRPVTAARHARREVHLAFVRAPDSGTLELPGGDATEPAKRAWLHQLAEHAGASTPRCDVICRVLDGDDRQVAAASFRWNGDGYAYTYEAPDSTTTATYSIALFDAQLPSAARVVMVTATGYAPLRIDLDLHDPARLAILELEAL